MSCMKAFFQVLNWVSWCYYFRYSNIMTFKVNLLFGDVPLGTTLFNFIYIIQYRVARSFLQNMFLESLTVFISLTYS